MSFRGVSKSFCDGHVVVCENVSFDVGEEIFCLLGLNGAGKSTLINCAVGWHSLTSGDFLTSGCSVLDDPVTCQRRIAVAVQASPAAARSTDSLLRYMCRLRCVGCVDPLIPDVLSSMDLSDCRFSQVGQLSFGQQRRVWCCAAFCAETRVIVLDEPSSGMDSFSRSKLWSVLRAAKESQRTVLLTTHYLDEADAATDRKAIMGSGRIVAVGTSSELKMSYGRGYILEITVGLTNDGDAEANLAARIRAMVGISVPAAVELPLQPQKGFGDDVEGNDHGRTTAAAEGQPQKGNGAGFGAVGGPFQFCRDVQDAEGLSMKFVLPFNCVSVLGDLLDNLETSFPLLDLGLGIAPLEEVFLAVGAAVALEDLETGQAAPAFPVAADLAWAASSGPRPPGRFPWFIGCSAMVVIGFLCVAAVSWAGPFDEDPVRGRLCSSMLNVALWCGWLCTVPAFRGPWLVALVAQGYPPSRVAFETVWLPCLCSAIALPLYMASNSFSEGAPEELGAWQLPMKMVSAVASSVGGISCFVFMAFFSPNTAFVVTVALCFLLPWKLLLESSWLFLVVWVLSPLHASLITAHAMPRPRLAAAAAALAISVLSAVVWPILLVVQIKARPMRCRALTLSDPLLPEGEDQSVCAERARLDRVVASGGHFEKDKVVFLDVSVVYPSSPPAVAVRNMTLGIRHGELFGLLGPNGAGKSSLIDLLIGAFRPPSFGHVFLDGADLLDDFSLLHRQLGLCLQADFLHPMMSPTRNLQIFSAGKGASAEEVLRDTTLLPPLLGLSEELVALDEVAYLSGGQRRRLAVACAVAGRCSIYVLDEPTAFVDPIGKREIWRMLHQLLEREKTILLTTHSMEEAQALCNRVTIQVRGSLRCLGSCDEIRRSQGGCFEVTLYFRSAGNQLAMEKTCEKMRLIVGVPVELVSVYTSCASFKLGAVGKAKVADALKKLLAEGLQTLGAESFSIMMPTLETIFLKVVTSD